MKKISLYLIIILLVSASVSGCGASKNEEDDILSVTTNEAMTEQFSEFESNTDDNNGIEKNVNTSIHLLGKDLELPCKFSELGDVQLDTETAFMINDTDVYGAIYNGTYRIGRIILSGCESADEDMSNKYIYYLELNPDFGFEGLDIEYNGFSYNTTKAQIIKAFGNPDEEFNNNVCYYLNNNEEYVEFEFIKANSEIESIKIKAK